jgi:cytochrome c peroxidase
MHNGLMASLDEVIDFYNQGGGPDRPGLKDSAMVPLRLTDTEKAELKEFLLALSGDDIGAAVEYAKPDLDYMPLPNYVNNDYTITNYIDLKTGKRLPFDE